MKKRIKLFFNLFTSLFLLCFTFQIFFSSVLNFNYKNPDKYRNFFRSEKHFQNNRITISDESSIYEELQEEEFSDKLEKDMKLESDFFFESNQVNLFKFCGLNYNTSKYAYSENHGSSLPVFILIRNLRI